jgi:anaerobic selenocysteine-containing dehydrogenase
MRRRCRRSCRRRRTARRPRARRPLPAAADDPKHHSRFLNSSYSALPKHGPAEGAPFVELSAADAAARGLSDGDQAVVFNDRASITVPVRIGQRVGAGRRDPVRLVGEPTRRRSPANALTNDTLTEWAAGGLLRHGGRAVEVQAP